MNSPILKFEYLITTKFEGLDPEMLEGYADLVKNKILNPNISLDYKFKPFQGPYCRINEKDIEIVLPVAYLEFLWSFIYSTLVICQEGVLIPMRNNVFDGQVFFDTKIKNRAESLFHWSIHRIKSPLEWNENLTSPIHYLKEEEKYINNADHHFLNAVTYLLSHEIAHVLLEHSESNQKYKSEYKTLDSISDRNKLQEAELLRIKSELNQMEGDADIFALNRLIFGATQTDGIDSKFYRGLSAIMACSAGFFAIEKINDFGKGYHANPATRVANIINALQLDNTGYIEAAEQYFSLIANRFLSYWNINPLEAKKGEVNEELEKVLKKQYEISEESLNAILYALDHIINEPDQK